MTGREFEKHMCQVLFEHGYWVHRINPDARGAQPFDIIALGDDGYIAADCKVCSRPYFPFSRLEENQRSAFDLLWENGGIKTYKRVGVFAYHNDKIYWIPWWTIKTLERYDKKGVRLDASNLWQGHTAC